MLLNCLLPGLSYYHGTNSSCTSNDISPVMEHTNVEWLHHMRISTTKVSPVGLEAKWMEILKGLHAAKHKWRTPKTCL
jgi:hypothetical protein